MLILCFVLLLVLISCFVSFFYIFFFQQICLFYKFHMLALFLLCFYIEQRGMIMQNKRDYNK